MSAPRRIIIIGPSGAGKSTVGEIVARELGVPLVSLDDFVIRGARKHQYVEHEGHQIRSYLNPACWDSNAFGCKLSALQFAGSGFVAEGNHLLHYPQIVAIPNTERYYLDVPFGTSLDRRKCRHKFLPADESFAIIGEEETARWVSPQLKAPGVVRLDGRASPEFTAAQIILRQSGHSSPSTPAKKNEIRKPAPA